VQRWRLRFARDAVRADQVGRVAMDAWQTALAASGLPLAGLEQHGAGRARFTLGAPLPAIAAGRAELADIWLVERRPAWAIREALEPRMPPAHHFVAAEDVWLGSPPLPGQIVGAGWIATLEPPTPDPAALERAVVALLAARALPRIRARASGDRAYDLRPLLVDLGPCGVDPSGRAEVRLSTRFDPALGPGRPEEVIAALGDEMGRSLAIAAIVRSELILADPRKEPPPRPFSPGRRPRR
jgi:hypothetical protein